MSRRNTKLNKLNPMYSVIITNYSGKYALLVEADNEREAIAKAMQYEKGSMSSIEAVFVKNTLEEVIQ